jgi:hypothetical protein
MTMIAQHADDRTVKEQAREIRYLQEQVEYVFGACDTLGELEGRIGNIEERLDLVVDVLRDVADNLKSLAGILRETVNPAAPSPLSTSVSNGGRSVSKKKPAQKPRT